MFNLIKSYRIAVQIAVRIWVASMACWMAASVQASDLSIYQPAQKSRVIMTMMLDTSGSMGPQSIQVDYGFSQTQRSSCRSKSGTNTLFSLTIPAAVLKGQILPALKLSYCPAPTDAIGAKCLQSASYIPVIAPTLALPSNDLGTALSGGPGTYCLTLLSRLTLGMFGLLSDNSTETQNAIIGLGQFPLPILQDALGEYARMLVPAALLGPVSSSATAPSDSASQRYILANEISKLVPEGDTPTASAYAEAAAYMLGNKASDKGFDYTKLSNTPGAGNLSVFNSAQTAYNSPVVANTANTCGQGVYILSDGVPTEPGAAIAQPAMQAALGTGSSFVCPSKGTVATGITPSTNTFLSSKSVSREVKSAWECMGSFAQALNNSNSLASDQKKYSLQTSLVAFGSQFQGLEPGVVPPFLTEEVNGKPNPNDVFQTYHDNINFCSLASRPSGDKCSDIIPGPSTGNPKGGYGGGGFYVATTPAQVTTSVQRFIQTLSSSKVIPLTTGSASIPVDSLNQNGFQPYAYFRALSPNPGNRNAMSWDGNIKKYAVNSSGIVVDATGQFVFQNSGALVGVNTSTGAITPSTKDLWNASSLADGGLVVDSVIGGVSYPASGTLNKIPMPTSATSPRKLRHLFTDLDTTGKDLMEAGTNQSLLKIPSEGTVLTEAKILELFKGTVPYNAVSVPVTATTNLIKPATQIQLLNFLGYNLPFDTALPATAAALTNSIASTSYLGGSLHSQPVSVTYSGSLDSDGNLLPNRTQSLLYGSMDGGIHLVDDSTDSDGVSLTTGGVEQMVFVPNEILTNQVAAQALKGGAENSLPLSSTPLPGQHTVLAPVPSQGADGHWVADASYKTTNTSSGGGTISASQMNVYGGLRMGGSGFYGLDILSCAKGSTCAPKLLFKISPATGAPFNTMGQSWSRPVLTNIRLANKITRVMIVGGGYDLCYENPRFKVGETEPVGSYLPGCSGITRAAGNSVYVVNAKTGAPIWTFTNDCGSNNKCTANSNMVDSIVSPVGIIDRDNDGLTDLLYFADLGGKLYRADLNNTYATTAANLGVRVTMLANLATTSAGAAVTAGDAPRFYEQPNITFFKQGSKSFYLVNVASGDRSNPLDILPAQSGGNISPLPTRPVNNVYGIIDSDSTVSNLIISNGVALTTKDLNLSHLLRNPQTNGSIGGTLYSGVVSSLFLPAGGTHHGWYRSLSANNDGTEPTVATYTGGVLSSGSKTLGGKKAFEKPLAIEGYLIVSVYDPEGTSVPSPSSCSPRVIGQTDSETFCLPYGVCLTSTGKVNTTLEVNTGSVANPLTSGTLMGPGIRGVTLVSPSACVGTACPKPTKTNCSSLDITNNQITLGSFSCETKLIPTRWYEKLPNANLVN